LSTPKVTAELRSYEFDEPYSAATFRPQCSLNFALTPRLGPARGRYEERWQPSRTEMIGDILFVPAGMKMRGSCAAGEQRALSCLLDRDLFEIDFDELDDRALSETLNVGSVSVRQSLGRVLRETTRPSLASPLALEAAGTLLAVDIARHLMRRQAAAQRRTGGLSRGRMRLIEERLRSEAPLPTLAELAADCDLSTRHLARAFQQETGRTIGEYVAAAGLERALRLLSESDLAVKEIAARLGFSSAASFAFAFRRSTGRRPSDVRKMRPRERSAAFGRAANA